jgi:hypothetical protein
MSLETMKPPVDVEEIIKLFKQLPKPVQISLSQKLVRYAKKEEVFILTRDDKSYEFGTRQEILDFFKSQGYYLADKSNVYKFADGKKDTMYGYKIKKQMEVL